MTIPADEIAQEAAPVDVEDAHLVMVRNTAETFAAAMQAAHEAGKRCVVLFEHYAPPRVKVVGTQEHTYQNKTGHYVQSPVEVKEVNLVTDEDV